MKIELEINGSRMPSARYVGWTPSPCRIAVLDAEGAALAPDITLRTGAGSVGALAFYPQPGQPPASTLTLSVPLDGTAVPFWLGGEFGRPSLDDHDTFLDAFDDQGTRVQRVPLMVRVRKNANLLTDAEQDRFVAVLAQLNDKGLGPFRTFRDLHTDDSFPEAHDNVGFLPWHRAYLLDLERTMQQLDPSVSLHYWRFDEPAPRVFDLDFMGVRSNNGMVRFGPANPLQFWATDGVTGIERRPLFDTRTQPARLPGVRVATEAQTLALGKRYRQFVTMEGQPHAVAHSAFDGFIAAIGTAVRDPLFFMLHANVDRLWAKWQWLFARFDAGVNDAYAAPAPARIGHDLDDTMWPWNEDSNPPRPPVPPGHPLPASALVSAPGPQPTVRSMLDLQGRIVADARLGYDYDDVPFD